MSGKLNQSLDEIVSSTRKASGRRNPRRSAGRPTTTAPVGGVQKNSKKPAAATKQAPTKAVGGPGDNKVVVSNLPKDVTEAQIKEYFVSSVGPIKRLELAYGPQGVSRGSATITFYKPEGATKAYNTLNGLLVDGRPIKIDIIVSGEKAAAIAPAKTLTERITQPKSQPKSAAPHKKKEAADKDAGAAGRGGRKRGARGGRSARPAKKTAEELDSEMADYFEAGNNQNENTNSGAPAAATNGDAPMDDEIM